MLTTAIIVFAIAAVFGLVLLTTLLCSRETPKPVVYLHGLIAAVGLVLLIVYSMNPDSKSVALSLTLFIIAAIGGFILFGRDLTKKPGPKWLALVHALVAVTSFLILLSVAFG
jgi:hypothetical protein